MKNECFDLPHKKQHPTIEEYVIIKVEEVEECYAKVKLLEYDNCIANLPLNLSTKKKGKKFKKHDIDVVIVQRMDTQKNFIDVSKKNLLEVEEKTCWSNYYKSKSVRLIILGVVLKILHIDKLSTTTNIADINKMLLYLYETVCWPLENSYSHTLEGFVVFCDILNNTIIEMNCEFYPQTPEELCSIEQKTNSFNIDPVMFHFFAKVILNKLTIVKRDFVTQVCLSCFNVDGILAIKESLQLVQNYFNSSPSHNSPISIRYVGGSKGRDSTTYTITTQHTDKSKGENFLMDVNNMIESEIIRRGGCFFICQKPKCINDDDRAELKTQIEHAQKEVNQISGDEPEQN